MKRKISAFILVLALMATTFTFTLFAEVPQNINYQGRLLTSIGEAMAGVMTITFKMFEFETGGSLLWEETQDVVFTDGYFNVTLGIITPLPQSIFANPLFIEIAIGSETLSPRKRLSSVPYALIAAEVEAGAVNTSAIADGAVTTYCIAAGAITSDRIASNTITSDDIATSAVNSDEIATGAVTYEKIALSAVTESWSGSKSSPSSVSEGAVVDVITLAFTLAHDGTVQVMAKGTTSGANLSYGRVTYTINVDGTILDSADNAIFSDTSQTQYYSAALLGQTNLTAGSHTIKLTVEGIDIDDSEQVSVSGSKLAVIALYK